MIILVAFSEQSISLIIHILEISFFKGFSKEAYFNIVIFQSLLIHEKWVRLQIFPQFFVILFTFAHELIVFTVFDSVLKLRRKYKISKENTIFKFYYEDINK